MEDRLTKIFGAGNGLNQAECRNNLIYYNIDIGKNSLRMAG